MSAVITKEDIKQEIEKVPDEKLESLYKYVRELTEVKPKKQSKESFMAKMHKIRINAPSDFATNIDDYLYGEKTIEDDIR